MAEVKVRLQDRERTTICTFGDSYRQPVLIKHTLDGFGLAVDEDNSRLVAARLHVA